MASGASLLDIYPDWAQHAGRLTDAIRGLDTATLALRAFPDQLPVWGLAAHVAGARVYWLCGVCGEPGADLTPFTEPLTGLGWEDDGTHPRTGEELARALEFSWSVVAGCLDRWSLADLGASVERTIGGAGRAHTRASILNRLFTHDAFHAGEISQLLGGRGLPGIDLWAGRNPAGGISARP